MAEFPFHFRLKCQLTLSQQLATNLQTVGNLLVAQGNVILHFVNDIPIYYTNKMHKLLHYILITYITMILKQFPSVDILFLSIHDLHVWLLRSNVVA